MKRTQRGTTLMEIAVTLAVIGVIASIALVNMDDVRLKQNERDGLREISILAIQARTSARKGQYPVRLAVHPRADRPGHIIRWEQLGCTNPDDKWGVDCPSAACQANACGTGGCTCVAVGEPIPVPDTLDISALDGLCWLARSAQPRQRGTVGSPKDCDKTAAPPQGPLRIKERGGVVHHLLQVDGLTGAMRMIDCTGSHPDPACTGP
ncbi:prepilin-type N-terminal cleavage/methylation domain-containing protein [Archangium violaceum]|uniref:pilus assembly FimT family protein n=1 Tax=Archangium violaceum TaxID=83451 RepID=UPI001951A9CE|nr:prepilin-type N-terminal cleavage/methylation domain-containing protein [Archangium violaceum]QRO01561.1 prepilin-type N-terminal cleavage/methylation domain-containing protein [Archangium violaceum]